MIMDRGIKDPYSLLRDPIQFMYGTVFIIYIIYPEAFRRDYVRESLLVLDLDF